MITGCPADSLQEGAEYHHNFQKWKACIVSRMEQPWLLADFLWKLHPKKREHDRAVENMYNFARQVGNN